MTILIQDSLRRAVEAPPAVRRLYFIPAPVTRRL